MPKRFIWMHNTPLRFLNEELEEIWGELSQKTTVQETDGDPAAYKVNEINFDQADGFTVTDDGNRGVTVGFSGGASDDDAIHDNVASEISAITEKASPVGADLLVIEDSADSNNKKRLQITNLPAGGEVNDLSAAVTWANVPDANITEGSVTQHEGAIDHDALNNFAAGEHRVINDAGTSATELWSASKVNTVAGTKIGAAGVTYENLDANSDVGTGATQVAQGDHTHIGGGGVTGATYCVSDSTGGQTMSTTVLTVNLDNELVAHADFSLAADVITIDNAGTYLCGFQVTYDCGGNVSTARDAIQAYIELNPSGGGYALVPQLWSSVYWREQSGEIAISWSAPLVVASGGDLIRLRSVQEAGTSTAFPLEADSSFVWLVRLA